MGIKTHEALVTIVINDNGLKNEKELVEVVKRSKEYEEYLKEIYRIISKHTEIKNIDWL